MSLELEAGSFRDRTSRIFYREGRVFRALSAEGEAAWEALVARKFFGRLVNEGKVVDTRRAELEATELAGLGPGWTAALEHDAIPFVTYPYEWPFSMLRDAAVLTLDLLEEALGENMVLKDASAYNIQWQGARPIFIDVGSFEEWTPGDPWAGYLQFCQLFLIPLSLTAYRDVSFQPWLRGSIDGITPQEARGLFSWRDCLRPGVLTDIVLQARLLEKTRPEPGTPTSLRRELQAAGFGKEMILRNVRRLRKILARLEWYRGSSEWASYTDECSYNEANTAAKGRFVETVVGERRRRLVWDLGANTGRFSRLAAANADTVVAMDIDHLAVDRFYRSLRTSGPDNILPLVMDLADASPSLGWRGQERRSLAERPRPELALCLALVHHLVIGRNVPLPELIDHLADLDAELIVEFVHRDDPMVLHLLRNKTDLYDDYDRKPFEQALGERFEIARSETLPNGTRTLYLARPRRD